MFRREGWIQNLNFLNCVKDATSIHIMLCREILAIINAGSKYASYCEENVCFYFSSGRMN